MLSSPQLNHNLTQYQPYIPLVGLEMKMTLYTTPPPHPTETQWQQYLSCYQSDFDETLGSWEHLKQIPTVRVTFFQATFVLVTFVHFRNISAVTGRFPGTSRTDFSFHRNICPGNNCPGNICPYQEYLSC